MTPRTTDRRHPYDQDMSVRPRRTHHQYLLPIGLILFMLGLIQVGPDAIAHTVELMVPAAACVGGYEVLHRRWLGMR